MIDVVIRAATESDEPTIVSIRNETKRHMPPQTLDEYRYAQAGASSAPTVASLEGKVVGVSVLRELKSVARPQTFFTDVAVAVDHRSQGIGTALYAHVLDQAGACRATRLYGEISKGDTIALAYFERRGFARTGRSQRISRLKVASARLQGYEGLVERIAASGIRITTLAAIGEGDQPFLRALHRMVIGNWRDIPGSEQLVDFPYDRWLRDLFSPGISADRIWIALAGDQPVGLASLSRRGDRGAYNHDTGVSREYRGRGIARVLKLMTIRWAINNGIDYIYTANEAANSAILSINIPLGYEEMPSLIEIAKDMMKPEPETRLSEMRATTARSAESD